MHESPASLMICIYRYVYCTSCANHEYSEKIKTIAVMQPWNNESDWLIQNVVPAGCANLIEEKNARTKKFTRLRKATDGELSASDPRTLGC